MSSYHRAPEGWGPSEPSLQRGDRTSSATIKQLTVGTRGPLPTPSAPPDPVDGVAARVFAGDRTPGHGRRAKGRDIGWASIRPEVLAACSVALRRMGDADITSIAVTSTSGGEGRTTVAVGLAAAVSMELRRKTILLDLDLEHAAVERMTSVSPGPGVIEFLYEEASIDECLQLVDQEIQIIRAGLPRDRAGITARIGRLTDLILQLRERCDVLIGDLPPLSAGVTTARIADLFDSVALVVRAGGVAIPHIEQTVSVLTQRPFVILNRTSPTQSSRIRKLFSSKS